MIVRILCCKIATVFFALCLVFLSTTSGQTAKEIANYASPSVVLLVGTNAKGKPVSLGSGFFVREDVIATNYHVIKGSKRLYIKLIGQRKLWPIEKVLASDSQRDLAILRISSITRKPLSLGDSDSLATGEDVYAIGNPEGLESTFSQGIVSGFRQFDGKRYIQITAPISQGSSGGPILGKSGDVVGITVGTLRQGQNLNFAIPVSYLISLLEQESATDEEPELYQKFLEKKLPAGNIEKAG
ncbi:MAG: S1C family serine protease, partial [Acidobacteriota bacterium]